MNQGQDIHKSAQAIDDLLNEDDNSLLATIAYYKSSVTEYIGRQRLVEMFVESVDKSDCITFISSRARRGIDPNRPVFSLTVNINVSSQKYPNVFNPQGTENSVEVISRSRANIIFEEACKPFSAMMNLYLE